MKAIAEFYGKKKKAELIDILVSIHQMVKPRDDELVDGLLSIINSLDFERKRTEKAEAETERYINFLMKIMSAAKCRNHGDTKERVDKVIDTIIKINEYKDKIIEMVMEKSK